MDMINSVLDWMRAFWEGSTYSKIVKGILIFLVFMFIQSRVTTIGREKKAMLRYVNKKYEGQFVVEKVEKSVNVNFLLRDLYRGTIKDLSRGGVQFLVVGEKNNYADAAKNAFKAYEINKTMEALGMNGAVSYLYPFYSYGEEEVLIGVALYITEEEKEDRAQIESKMHELLQKVNIRTLYENPKTKVGFKVYINDIKNKKDTNDVVTGEYYTFHSWGFKDGGYEWQLQSPTDQIDEEVESLD